MPVDNDMERLRRIERAAQSVCAIRVSHKTAAEKQALDRLAEVLDQ
jgi:HAMP domain-containing protein